MIIQCEECSTRFRLADEKLKPTGTKVRCSRCKHIFTVMPPTPEPAEEPASAQTEEPFASETTAQVAAPKPPIAPPAPETAAASEPTKTTAATDEEEIDFDSMNMEAVAAAPATHDESAEATDSETASPSDQGTALDFSGLEQELAAAPASDEELADDFSFAAPSESTEEEADEASQEPDEFVFDETDGPEDESPGGLTMDANETFTEEDPDTFEFGENDEAVSAAAQEFEFDEPEFDEPNDEPGTFEFDEPAGSSDEFVFDEPESAAIQNEPVGDEDSTFAVDEGEDTFSFDEPSGVDTGQTDTASEWGELPAGDEDTFAFDAPDFEAEAPAFDTETPDEDDSLKFGEIDLPQSEEETDNSFGTDNAFAGAELETEEPSLDVPPPSAPPRSPVTQDEDMSGEPLPAPPIKRKSSLSRILLLLILLLLTLGGAAGYFYMQDGALNINSIMQRVTGQAPQAVEEHKIGIQIIDTSYVNNRQAGQLLVVQGKAINNFPGARSAITVKGVLLDTAGKSLFQQTVSCGNPLDETALERAPFEKIEEAMNNQFGDSLSNMNVAAGASIPFTIVFRNLPESIANINVEVVNSKPGSN